MNAASSAMEHKSSIGGDIAYITYEWSIKHWSLLYDYYDSITSPPFEIMYPDPNQSETRSQQPVKCVMNFSRLTSGIELVFIGEFKYRSVQANVHILKNKMRVLTARSPRTRSFDDSLKFSFTTTFDEAILRREYLHNDTLVLFLELNIVKDIVESSVTTNTWNSTFNFTSGDILGNYLRTAQFHDVTFLVDEKCWIPAHKIILAAQSETFRKMFKSEPDEVIVEIQNVDVKIFKIFLKYMYTGRIDRISEVVTELSFLAHRYKVIGLLNECSSYMMAHISIKNAFLYLLTAHKLKLTDLESQALPFIRRNTKLLANTEVAKSLSKYPKLIIRIFQ